MNARHNLLVAALVDVRMNLDYPTWAIPAEAFAAGSLRIWRRQFRRAFRKVFR